MGERGAERSRLLHRNARGSGTPEAPQQGRGGDHATGPCRCREYVRQVHRFAPRKVAAIGRVTHGHLASGPEQDARRARHGIVAAREYAHRDEQRA